MQSKLCCVKVNQICKIISVSGKNKHRLLEMGFIKNREVIVINKSIGKGPIEFLILNYKIALRYEDANFILVDIL